LGLADVVNKFWEQMVILRKGMAGVVQHVPLNEGVCCLLGITFVELRGFLPNVLEGLCAQFIKRNADYRDADALDPVASWAAFRFSAPKPSVNFGLSALPPWTSSVMY
jgi:hypothetical protein